MSGKRVFFPFATLHWQVAIGEIILSCPSMPHFHFSFPIAGSGATISKREEKDTHDDC